MCAIANKPRVTDGTFERRASVLECASPLALSPQIELRLRLMSKNSKAASAIRQKDHLPTLHQSHNLLRSASAFLNCRPTTFGVPPSRQGSKRHSHFKI